MVGGRRRSLSCSFTLSAVLLVGVCLLDVEASTCPSSSSIIHKNVGDTVKLSSCLPTEGVTLATWKLGNIMVADKDLGVTKEFRDRFDLNTDFSLTVKRLTLQDSGVFSFISLINDKQRPTVVITLQVHEPITKEPDVTVNSTWDDSDKSCTVLLECSSTSDRSVTYSWSVKNQTQSGSRLKVNIRPADGETTVTCTISDHVSKKSTSKPVKCSNNTDSVLPPESSSLLYVPLIVGLVVFVMTALLLSLLYYKKSKETCCNRLKTSNTPTVIQGETEQPVYSSLLHSDGCVYESIRRPEDAEKDEQSTVYSNVTTPSIPLNKHDRHRRK